MVTLLSIIILSYNTEKLTRACMQSLFNQYEKELASGEFEMIIVDNASSDDTVATIQQFNNSIMNKIKLIQNEENYGYASGNNIGAKESSGKYLLFLNSDTEVKDRGLIEMVKFLDNNKSVAVLGAKLLNSDGTSQPSSGKFLTLGNIILWLMGAEKLLRSSSKVVARVDWVSGAAFMVRRDLFKKLTGFDKHFFMYLEDMELCWRAKLAGFLTYFYPSVSIMHRSLGSSNRSFAIVNIYKGLLYFYKKHTNKLQYLIVKLLLVTKAYFAILAGTLFKNNYLTLTYKKALISL